MTLSPPRRLAAVLVFLCLRPAMPADVLHAQQAPYDVFPPAEPPYYRVRYEPSKTPGELAFGVNYTAWVPPGLKTLRGVIVHQHGCGEGSCKSGLTGAYDLHWQALARKHDCALLAPAYEQPEKADCQMWCDPRNGSSAAFLKALADLGVKSGHPELAEVPWALWGHSGGGHWAGGMVLMHPDRVAAAWLRSGVPQLKPNPDRPSIKAHELPDAALKVPMMCNLGTKEGVTVKNDRFSSVWPANEAFFGEVRPKGGLIGVAVDPLTSHECGNQRYLAIPWLDACLAARLPQKPGEPLKPMPTDVAWLAPPTGSRAVPASTFSGDPLKEGWLPGAAVARAWVQYVKDANPTDATPPPAPTNLRVDGADLRWECEADLESGLAGFVIERDGKVLARIPEKPGNPFGRPLFQNLQYSDTPTQPLASMRFADATAAPGSAHTYRIIAVNTSGLESEPSVGVAAGEDGKAPSTLSRADGYVGCWYAVGATKDEYRYKYSGGMATYPQQHAPIAVYDKASNRTFFVYGGADPERKSILHMVSYYDHDTGTVPRPAILLDKKTNDAHDNPTLQIDAEGRLWIFSNAHGTGRPSYIHRSVAPRSIDAFEKVVETNFSYGDPWYVPGRGFLFLHTKYQGGRGLRFIVSADGRDWSEPSPIAHIDMGDYLVSWGRGPTVAMAFDFHPRPLGLDARTNLYYLQTSDFGETWTRADGQRVELPLSKPDNPALVRDYQTEGKLVYLKDVNFDADGRPVILFLTSKGHQPGLQNGPHAWQTARWDGREWIIRPFTTSDHNYDHGSLSIEDDGLWRVIAPTDPGPQPFGTGGDMVMWTSADQGATWTRVKRLTADPVRNHTYARRPVFAHPDFYAIWADGDARTRSESRLYICDRLGRVRRLPDQMTAETQSPEVVPAPD